jgi:Protein of unknown function (DUF5818)
MRQLLALSLLLLGVSWAAAQNSPATSPKSSASANAGTQTVQGCLSGSDGKFMLTDKNGQTYDLTGDTSKLAEHVGHEVKITGAASSGAGSATSSQAGMTLEVSSVKHISKTCKNSTGGGMAH